jgi:hypothetical protein
MLQGSPSATLRGFLIEKFLFLFLSSSSGLKKKAVYPFEALVHFCKLHGI